MNKTPEEIKKGLKCAIDGCLEPEMCEVCPYYIEDDDVMCYVSAMAKDALTYIEQLESKQQKWISVDERMPEKLNENNQVCLSEYVIGFDGERYCVGQFKVYKYDGSCTFFDGYEFTDKITHWMPLPEQPEEG